MASLASSIIDCEPFKTYKHGTIIPFRLVLLGLASIVNSTFPSVDKKFVIIFEMVLGT